MPARAELDDGTRQELALGRLLPASVVARARRLRVLLRDAVREAFDTHRLDALLVPASPLGAVHRDGRPAPLPDGHGGLSGASYIASLTGQPAVVLPLLRGPEPIGVQLVGRPFADDALLDVAAALEGALDRRADAVAGDQLGIELDAEARAGRHGEVRGREGDGLRESDDSCSGWCESIACATSGDVAAR